MNILLVATVALAAAAGANSYAADGQVAQAPSKLTPTAAAVRTQVRELASGNVFVEFDDDIKNVVAWMAKEQGYNRSHQSRRAHGPEIWQTGVSTSMSV